MDSAEPLMKQVKLQNELGEAPCIQRLRFGAWQQAMFLLRSKSVPGLDARPLGERAGRKRKHLLDCLMHTLLRGPDFIDRSKRPQDFDPIYPNLAY